jgi:hypothetical protein
MMELVRELCQLTPFFHFHTVNDVRWCDLAPKPTNVALEPTRAGHEMSNPSHSANSSALWVLKSSHVIMTTVHQADELGSNEKLEFR